MGEVEEEEGLVKYADAPPFPLQVVVRVGGSYDAFTPSTQTLPSCHFILLYYRNFRAVRRHFNGMVGIPE